MEYEKVLPEGFDGTFRFTNWSDEDFVGKWGSKDYLFPAKSTSPIIIPENTPLEVQQIRKKFAKDLAEREFFNSAQYAAMKKQEVGPGGEAILSSMHKAASYSIDQLAPYIQRALEPLQIAEAKVTVVKRVPLEETLSRNSDGELNTEVIDKGISLKQRALSKK